MHFFFFLPKQATLNIQKITIYFYVYLISITTFVSVINYSGKGIYETKHVNPVYAGGDK